jgi:hypothetical protein
MADDPPKVRRTLQFRFTVPGANPEHIVAMLRAAKPFYEVFGAGRARLLQNVDDPARFVQEVEYDMHEFMEINRQRVASDPRVQTYLQTWRSMLPNGVQIDVYREVE